MIGGPSLVTAGLAPIYTPNTVWRDALMHGNDLINLARKNLGEPDIATVMDAVLALHGHGVADDSSGDVEAPCGHFVRADRWIVRTDERGFNVIEEYDDEAAAIEQFARYEDEYSDWGTDARVEAANNLIDPLVALLHACDGDEAAYGEALYEIEKAARMRYHERRDA